MHAFKSTCRLRRMREVSQSMKHSQVMTLTSLRMAVTVMNRMPKKTTTSYKEQGLHNK